MKGEWAIRPTLCASSYSVSEDPKTRPGTDTTYGNRIPAVCPKCVQTYERYFSRKGSKGEYIGGREMPQHRGFLERTRSYRI